MILNKREDFLQRFLFEIATPALLPYLLLPPSLPSWQLLPPSHLVSLFRPPSMSATPALALLVAATPALPLCELLPPFLLVSYFQPPSMSATPALFTCAQLPPSLFWATLSRISNCYLEIMCSGGIRRSGLKVLNGAIRTNWVDISAIKDSSLPFFQCRSIRQILCSDTRRKWKYRHDGELSTISAFRAHKAPNNSKTRTAFKLLN